MFEYIEDNDDVEDFGSEITTNNYINVGYTERYSWYVSKPAITVLKKKVNHFSADFFLGAAVTLIAIAAITSILNKEERQ
jgi:hypothetical protein